MFLFEYRMVKKKVPENGRFSIFLKVEIRIKTKNGIEGIIEQKHGKAGRGKKVPTAGANRQQSLPLSRLCVGLQ